MNLYVQTRHNRPLGVPVTIPQAIITRAVAYCRRGYSAEEVAKICGLNLSHARLIKKGV